MMKIDAVIAMKTDDNPKINVGAELMGAHQVTFDLYGVDPTFLLSLVGKMLRIQILEIDGMKELDKQPDGTYAVTE